MAMGERTADETTQLGPYRLRGRLGEGGMGVVHLGLDPSGRAVAVKVLRAHIAHDPEARARLAREVSTLRRVRHPLVAEVIDADVDGAQPYVVTRFVPGSGLDAVVRERGALPPVQLLRLGRGLSGALRAIHDVSVVHRDLKPANVLLLEGDPVVIDFGIAHVADDVRLTSTGLVMGTPGYLSPEVIDGGRVTEATDWWGWAATLSFAASGRPPFGRGPMDVVIDRVRRGQADLAGVDVRLQPLLAAALSVDPRARPGEGEVLAALDRYARGEPATVTVPVGTPYSAYSPVRVFVPPTAVSPASVASVSATAVSPASVPARSQTEQAAPLAGRRSGVLAALLLALVGGALAYPVAVAVAALVLCVLARTVDRNRLTLARRRYERGPRRSDVVVATISSPWHLARSVLVTALSSLLPALLGLAAAFSAGLAIPAADGSAAPDSLPAVGAGAFVALLAIWWGPGGGSLRRGAHTTLRVVVPSGQQVGWSIALMLLAAAGAVVAVRAGSSSTWPTAVRLPFGPGA